MSRKVEYLYLDSNVYLAIFNNERNIDGVDRVYHSRYYIEEAERGKFKILASTLVISEIYRIFKAPNYNGNDNHWNIWEWDFVEIVDVDIKIALESVKLMNNCHTKIRPPDSIHLATALHYKNLLNLSDLDFLTWDDILIHKCNEYMSRFNLRLSTPRSRKLNLS